MGRRLAGAVLVLAIGILPGCTVYGERPTKILSDATGGEGLERAFWHDVESKNWRDLDHHIASKFTYMHGTRRLDHDAALDELHKLNVREYSIGDLVTQLNGDTFVVSYTITLRGSVAGQEIPSQPQQRMTVWHQQKSGWMMIAHSVLGPE